MPQSLDPTYPLFPVLSFLGFVVALVPFPWHLQAWNSGTCAFMLWTSLACLVEFVNSLIWAGNVDNNIPVWCDICAFFQLFEALSWITEHHFLPTPASKFLLGAGVGIIASSLCISRRLYNIATTQNVSISHSDVRVLIIWTNLYLHWLTFFPLYQKRRAVIVDLCIAIGIPFLVMLLRQYSLRLAKWRFLIDHVLSFQTSSYNLIATTSSKTLAVTQPCTTRYQPTFWFSCGPFYWAQYLSFILVGSLVDLSQSFNDAHPSH